MKEFHISEFYGRTDSQYRHRRAIVSRDEHHFIVRMYDKDKVVNTELLENHSLAYAEDAAENWVEGVGKFKDLEAFA